MHRRGMYTLSLETTIVSTSQTLARNHSHTWLRFSIAPPRFIHPCPTFPDSSWLADGTFLASSVSALAGGVCSSDGKLSTETNVCL
jgi:hypothetical protein